MDDGWIRPTNKDKNNKDDEAWWQDRLTNKTDTWEASDTTKLMTYCIVQVYQMEGFIWNMCTVQILIV